MLWCTASTSQLVSIVLLSILIKREAKGEKDIHLSAKNGPLSRVLPPIVINSMQKINKHL